ncbi:MAG: D-alanyl-D-alanine carboxypeptidase [Thermoplasmata archaeon]
MNMLEGIYFPAKKISINENKYFIPASNTKILTSFFAIKALGENYSFFSKYYVKNNKLFISTNGNPLITKNDLSTIFSNLSYDIEEIIIDSSFLLPTPTPPGWCQDDLGKSYAPFISEINYEFNRKNKLVNGKILSVAVNNPMNYFLNEIKYGIWKKFGKKKINVIYKKWEWENKGEYFAKRKLGEMLKIMNKNSENSIAEMLLLHSGMVLGGKGLENSLKKMKKLFKNQNINGFKIYDGSGLSYYNIIKPKTIVKVLDLLKDVKIFKDSLPIGSIDGTLKNRLSPRVIAKTGTLHNVQNLSGYLDDEPFSIMLNGVDDQENAKKYIDSFLLTF